jgi:prepilin-type N-terminal cleavage/methylation domain-containing protein
MKKMRKGFTLVEFLIVTALLGIIGSVVLSVLFTTFRVSKKADSLVELRQTGDSVVSQVVKNIRYAKSLDYPTSCVGGVVSPYVTVSSIVDSSQTTFSCEASSLGGKIASNGASLIDDARISATNCFFTCTQNSPSDPPTINFSFRLQLLNDTVFSESQAFVPFQTSVILRNHNQ